MKTAKFLILFSLLFTKISAQDFDNYQTLLSHGNMPEDFRLMASEKYRQELAENTKKALSIKDKKRMRNFALESNFALTDMMMSGRVIYGDDLGKYINKIADEILKDDEELSEKLRFYIVKSTVANAFSTNQGIIFVTTGLIAQVENEAQLAFILAHEIIHYTEKHNYEAFKKREAILTHAGRKSTVSVEEKLKSLYKYSKNNETEADEKGMIMFLKTKYNPYSAVAAFDVLLYSYLPFDMIEWKPSVFETEYYKFPEELTEKKLTEISADPDEDDSKQSHPNMGKRKANIINVLEEKSADSAGKSLYIVSKLEFLRVQKIARFELASLYLISGNPAKAYYVAYLLDNIYGSNTYTDKIKLMSIYSLAHHSTHGENLDNYGCDDGNYEGEVQQIARFFSKLKSKDISVLASKYSWEMYVKYPKDEKLMHIRDQLFYDMFVMSKLPKSGFTEYKPPSADTLKTGNSKVDKLKTKQKTKDKSEKYFYAAFHNLLKEKEFKSYFAEISKRYSTSDKEEDENDGDEYVTQTFYKKESKKSKTNAANKTKELQEDIASVVIFNPDYNAKIKDKTNLLNEESKQDEIAFYYKEEAKRAGIELQVLDMAGRENFNTESFNKFAVLKDWLTERFSNDTLTMELYQKETTLSTLGDYKTKHLGWSGTKYWEDVRSFDPYFCVVSILLYPLFPIYLTWQLSKDKQLENLILVYDIETGKAVLTDYSRINKRPSKMTMKATIYNQLYNFKNGK